jgi:thioredoxin 1
MKKNILIAAIVAALFATSCSREKTPDPAALQEKNIKTDITQISNAGSANKDKKGTLLFFINPNGTPCQMQDAILKEALPSIKDIVNIKYIQTTNDYDTEYFYKYSIRGLPSIIIIDKKNNTIKRFSPGIQSAAAIIETVKEL